MQHVQVCKRPQARKSGAMEARSGHSQVSIDDILEYTSTNGDLSPEEQAADETEELVPPDLLPQSFPPTPAEPAALPWYLGQNPITSLAAVSKESLSAQTSGRYIQLLPPTPAMLASAQLPEISELIPQDHPAWQTLRSGKVTGSSLAEFLGLFEHDAGCALYKAGVHKAMLDPAKLKAKVLSLQQEVYATATVDAKTQVSRITAVWYLTKVTA